MCHNVHMKTITVRELHMNTGRYVRSAVQESLVVTDRGRAVAALTKLNGAVQGRSLPNREAWIKKQPQIRVDSTRLVSADRSRA
jgi:antitoxin (DNA-binding transcriptional repressor) of toxin-antitoxin stability system